MKQLQITSTDNPTGVFEVATIEIYPINELLQIGKVHLTSSVFVTGSIQLEMGDIFGIYDETGNNLPIENYEVYLVVGDDDSWYVEVIDQETQHSYLTDLFEI